MAPDQFALSRAQFACRLAFLLTTALGVGAMVLIWLFYPATYDYGTVLNDSHYFYRTQRVGVLPDASVPWRGNSLLQEYAIPDGTKKYDFGGGWMTVRTLRPPFAAGIRTSCFSKRFRIAPCQPCHQTK
jgi:hypothetical protein